MNQGLQMQFRKKTQPDQLRVWLAEHLDQFQDPSHYLFSLLYEP